MTDTDDLPTDDMNLLPSGMVRLAFDGSEIMLRRPKIGELRELRELLNEINDEVSRRSAEVQGTGEANRRIGQTKVDRINAAIEEALAADPVDEDAVNRLVAERSEIMARTAQTDRDGGRTLIGFSNDRRAEWLAKAVEILAIRGTMPDDRDEWPTWSVAADLAPTIVNHWRTVPSRSGG